MKRSFLAVLFAPGLFLNGALAADSQLPATLAESLEPLVADFNDAEAVPRFVTILSPTCPACKLGADVMRDVILSRKNAPDFRMFVVWAPMLKNDDAVALEKMASTYGDLRTRNYLDPNRRTGQALRRSLFPNVREAMLSALPTDHFFRGYAERMSGKKPEWDIYLAFEPDVRWDDRPPKPAAWVRQVARYPGEEKDSYVSVMFVNDYATLPVEGSLAEQVERLAKTVLKAR